MGRRKGRHHVADDVHALSKWYAIGKEGPEDPKVLIGDVQHSRATHGSGDLIWVHVGIPTCRAEGKFGKNATCQGCMS